MASRFSVLIIFFFFLVSCKKEGCEVRVNYDEGFVIVINCNAKIVNVQITNSVGKSIYEMRLKDNQEVLNRIMLFTPSSSYFEQGGKASVSEDNSKKHIQITVKLETIINLDYAGAFNPDNHGEVVIPSVKKPFP